MTDPGLDLTRLRALRRPRHDPDLIQARIRHHLQLHDGYLAFSGGKDSLVALDLARRVDPNIPVAFFDSGLEYPETYTYLDQLAERWSLNLTVIPARLSVLQILARNGSWDHHAPDRPGDDMHHILITEPAATAHRQFGPGELWGVRADESRGRAALYSNALTAAGCDCEPGCDTVAQRRARHGGTFTRTCGDVVYGPVWDWTNHDIWSHIAAHQLPANPVYQKLRDLGAPDDMLRVAHLVDANRLEVGRLVWLRRGWPDLFEELATVLPRAREYI